MGHFSDQFQDAAWSLSGNFFLTLTSTGYGRPSLQRHPAKIETDRDYETVSTGKFDVGFIFILKW